MGGAYGTYGEKDKNISWVLVGKPSEKRPLGSLSTYERILLKWIVKNMIGWCGLFLCDSG
jgi:hypothetical protein